MKLLNIDWADFYERLVVWDRLALGTRRVLGQLKSSKGVSVNEFGGDLSRLTKAKFLSLYVAGDRAKLHKDCYPFARVIRAMSRHDILGNPDDEMLSDYIVDHFTSVEQEALSPDDYYRYDGGGLVRRAMSAQWLQDFLSLDNLEGAEEWETTHQCSRRRYPRPSDCPILKSARALDAAQSVVRELMASTESMSFTELKDRFKHLSPSILADATYAGIRYLLLFPSMRYADMTPMINVWPSIRQRLHRPTPKPPTSVTPDQTFHCAFLMEDMTTVLVNASGKPPRVRSSDQALFTKATQELESSLLTLPEWLTKTVGCTPGQRVGTAVEFLKGAALIETVGERGKDLRLEPTATGHDWLGLSSKDRLKSIFDRLTADRMPKPAKSAGGVVSDVTRDQNAMHHARGVLALAEWEENDDDEYDEYDDYYDAPYESSYGKRAGFLPQTLSWNDSPPSNVDISAAIIEAYGSVTRRRFLSLLPFVEYHTRQVNPLLNPPAAVKSPKIKIGWSWRKPTEEEAENYWQQVLIDFFCHRLLPLGCAEAGFLKKTEDLCFALTEAGRFFLGLKKTFDYGHRSDRQSHIVVQPNFDVVFLAPAPLAEANISRFAKRTGQGTGTLFRITKQSIFAAASQRLTADQTLGTLRDVSTKTLPTNVTREIQGWFDQCEHVAMKAAVVIRCPDAQTASRVLSMGGKKVSSISDTVLELADRQFQTQLVKKLKETGVFVDLSSMKVADRKPVPRRRRRRRYW